MEMLPGQFLIPEKKPGQNLDSHVHELRLYVEDYLNQTTKRINWLLERIHVTTETAGVLDRNGTRFMVIEWIPPGKTKNDDGNFRERIVAHGNNFDLYREVRIDGVWTDVEISHG